ALPICVTPTLVQQQNITAAIASRRKCVLIAPPRRQDIAPAPKKPNLGKSSPISVTYYGTFVLLRLFCVRCTFSNESFSPQFHRSGERHCGHGPCGRPDRPYRPGRHHRRRNRRRRFSYPP